MQRIDPVVVARFNLVELVLQLRSELHVQQVGEILDQQAGQCDAEFRRHQPAFLILHVLPVTQRPQDGSISAGTPDTQFLQLTDQGSLGVSRRRLREVLVGNQLANLHLLAFLENRQRGVMAVLVLFPGGFSLRFLINRGKTREAHHGTGGAKSVRPGLHVNPGLIDDRRTHLTGHHSVPDQGVKRPLFRG